MVKIAMDLTEVLSLTVSTKQVKIYLISFNYNISAKVPSAMHYWDHFTLTLCVTMYVFKIYSFSVDMSLSDKSVTFVGRCHFCHETIGFLADVSWKLIHF